MFKTIWKRVADFFRPDDMPYLDDRERRYLQGATCTADLEMRLRQIEFDRTSRPLYLWRD